MGYNYARSPILMGLSASGQPVVALVSPSSETARVIREADCGIVVDPCDIEGLKKPILNLKDDYALLSSFGRRRRSFFEGHMGAGVVVAAYRAVFEDLEKIISENPRINKVIFGSR